MGDKNDGDTWWHEGLQHQQLIYSSNSNQMYNQNGFHVALLWLCSFHQEDSWREISIILVQNSCYQ